MKVSLRPNEEILHEIPGYSFEINPIKRLIMKFMKLLGFVNKAKLTVTNERFVCDIQYFVLFAIRTRRIIDVIRIQDLSSVAGYTLTMLIILKSYNLVLISEGMPLTGINLKKGSQKHLESLLNDLSTLLIEAKGETLSTEEGSS